VLCLYLEVSTVEFIAEKLEHPIFNDRRLYDTVITLFITTKQVICSIPKRVSTLIIQQSSLPYKVIISFVSVHSIRRYSSPSSHEITIGFVSSLIGYLMYYVRKQRETNTNTNKVIMTKLYGVSCCVIVCVIICVVSCCVEVTNNIFHVQLIILYGRMMRTEQ